MIEAILLIILIILLIGFLGGSVVVKHDDKETNLNDKINETVEKVKDKINENK